MSWIPPEVSSTNVRIGCRRLVTSVSPIPGMIRPIDAAMLHRHELAHIVGIERPGVDDLLPPRIDDLERLAF